jgi:hypothetical protein
MNKHIPAAMALATSFLFASACASAAVAAAGTQSAAAPAAAAASAAPPAPHAAGHGAVSTMLTPLPKSDRLVVAGYAGPVSADWLPYQPTSAMRSAQFVVPAAPGAATGELIAYFFPVGQGGKHDENIARWTAEFASADGKPVTPTVVESKNGALGLTLVTLNGTYARGAAMVATGGPKPDQTLLVAMVETPGGRITLQMFGPRKTVALQRDNFVKLAKGFAAVPPLAAR